MSSCSYHASKESVAACRNCGKLVCKACNNEIDGKSYCPPCVEKLFAVKKAEGQPAAAPPVVKEQPVPAQPTTVAASIPDKAPAIEKEMVAATAPEPSKQVVKAAAPVKPAESIPPAQSEKINPLWWVAVFFLGWIGGLIAWFKNKQQFPSISRYMLYGGIGWSALQALVAGIFLFTSVIAPAIGNIKLTVPGKASKPATGSQEVAISSEETYEIVTAPKHYVPPEVKRSATGTILTETPAELTSTQINTKGGTVTVNKPGDPLNGLEITVPPGAYTDARTFTVSSAPITVNTFEEGVNPITPMIKVENGGGDTASPMALKIPVQVPEGQSVIWYYYDPESGTIEAAPVLAVDKDSVTVAVSHFSEGFLSSMYNALMPTEIDSGFRPGVDSWQMPNAGSTLSAEGICEGMSMGAMWYYFTRPDGSDKNLFGRYDNNGEPNPPTPSLWHDDARAIRFCSVLQEDYDNHKPSITIWNPAANAGKGATDNETTRNWWVKLREASGDNLTRSLFESAMLGSHEPQMVFIYALDGNGGHAMVVYKIVDGTLFISDPNKQGATTEIRWENGRYLPYTGFANPYGHVTYIAKSTIISDWGKIQGYWDQLKDGTIGDGIFPAYKVMVVDDKGDKDELKDGYESTDGSLNLEFDNPQLKYELYTADPLTMGSLSKLTEAADGKYYLKDQGETMLGIYVSDQANEWVDFKWYKVKSGAADAELKIEAPGTQGYTDEPCTFKAITKNMPKEAILEWYFYGDAEEQGTKYKDTDSATHTFKTSGDKTITCQIIKGKEVKPLAKDTVTYKVVQPPLDIIANPPKGAVGQTSTFQLARSNPLPQDAKYTWSFGNGKSGQGEEASTTYDEAKTYTVSVTATWASKVGKTPVQEHTTGELKYEVVDALPLKIIASPATGIAGEKTSFNVEGENIPNDVAFYWEFGDEKNEGNVSSIQKDGATGHTYTKENTYTVKVSMLDKKNPKPLAFATLRYNVEPPATLAIVAPTEIIQGKGITEKTYTFKSTWEPGKAPDGVSYTWIYNGGTIGTNAEKSTSFTSVGHYVIELKAQWKDLRGVAREAVAQPLEMDITGESTFVIVAADNFLESGSGVTDKEYTITTDWSPEKAPAGVNYTWAVNGEGAEDQGGKILHTFKAEGKHTVTARAKWQDATGAAQTADNNRIFNISLPKQNISLTCTDSDIQNNQKGVTGKVYTFNTSWDTGKAPAGVKYRWFVDGNEIAGKTGATETFSFPDEKENNRINVQADWDTPGGKHEWSLGQLIFKIETPTNFSVRCADSGLQGSHKGVPDKDYRFYTYWGDGGEAPPGTSYAWFLNDEETGDTAEDAHFTLAADPQEASKSYTVKAVAKWSDSAGNEKSASDTFKFDVGAAPSLSITVPEEVATGKGVTGRQYTFTASATNIPAGADYTWYSDGTAKKKGKDLKSASNTFTSADDYVLKVEAKWTDSNKKTQTVTSPEVSFHINEGAVITLVAPADIKANKGLINKEYTFSADTKNIPDGAEYTWYSGGAAKKKGVDLKTVTNTFSTATDYVLKVEAKWTDSNDQSQSAVSPEVKFTIGSEASVAIVPPGSLAKGPAVPEQSYVFAVKPTDLPKDASYTWYLNEKEIAKGNQDKKPSIKTEKEPQDYELKVVAQWKDNKKQMEVEDTFEFSTLSGLTLSDGQFISGGGACSLEKFPEVVNAYLDQVLSKITITIANDKVSADQTVPFTISTGEGSASGSARVIVNGTYNKGKLNGTFSVNGTIEAKGEDNKSFMIDLNYVGNISASDIPQSPKGESVTCAYTGTISSQALYQLIVSLGEAFASCASESGGTSETTTQMPTSPDFCTDYVTHFKYTATVTGK